MKLSVIGLGKLGASMAAAFASRGFEVIGVDVNQKAVDAVNAGHAPVQETDLEETINRNAERIRATLDHTEAIVNSDLSFVIVPTPSDENGAFSLQYAKWAFREIGKALAAKKDYHNVVLTSTVLPGSTRYGLLPILESESGKKCGESFGLCYSPEFIALGSVLHDFLNPDFTLIGEFDDQCGRQLEACYQAVMENKAPCKRMSLENAELAKISVNTFVTTKISFANMLAELCEKIPGGDVDIVTDALGADSRIGSRYFKGGLGYGGPCFPRDNVALGYISRKLGVQASLAETTDQFNRYIPEKTFRQIERLVKKGSTIAVLGLAYKPMSHIVEESQSIALARSLANSGARVIGYDPLAGDSARNELAYDALVLDSLETCLEQADTVLITTPDPIFQQLKAGDFKRRPVTVIDFWRFLDEELTDVSGINYIPVGRGTGDLSNEALLQELWGNE